MRSSNLSRVIVASLLCGSLIAATAGCSRSSNSGGGGGGGNVTPGPGGGTATPITPGVPSPTPGTPGAPTPTAVIIDVQGTNISDIIKTYPNGARLIISPGTYPPIELTGNDISGPLTLQADETGLVTGRSGAITILAQDRDAAINLNGLNNVLIDGVSTIGGRRAGMLIRNGTQIILQSNRVRGASGDGIRIERSSAVLVFNNAIYDNDGIGLSARALNTMEAVNNTVYGNRGGGIAYLRLAFDGGTEGSPFGFLLNNIIAGNSGYGIRVDDDSTFGYGGNFNLNNDGYIGVAAGNRDLQADPMFIFPGNGDFRLQHTVGAGGSPAFDRGDPNTESYFVAILRERTTRIDNFRDQPPVDLGYHYPFGIDTPTPPPTFTPRGGAAFTSTPTFTPTPTATVPPTSQSAAASAAQVGAAGSSLIVLPTPTATATPAREVDPAD